jgi:EAL domain-containing protein (putative c-di-GMP-specific phosphodiesterase class I)
LLTFDVTEGWTMQKRTSEIGLCEFFANQQMTPTCAGHAVQLPKIHIAFQAIVNVSSRSVIAYEALVRGQNGQGYPELVAGMD